MSVDEYIAKDFVSVEELLELNFTYDQLYEIANYNKAEHK